MNKPENSNLEDPEEIIDEIEELVDTAHQEVTDAAITLGQVKSVLPGIRSEWGRLSEASTDDPIKIEVYKTGVEVLRNYRDDTKVILSGLTSNTPKVKALLMSTDSTMSMTGGTAHVIQPGYSKYVPSKKLAPLESSFKETIEKINDLDPTGALGKTYQGIREVILGTRSDPERGAMFLLRQAFDHLFGILSPDIAVRASKFFVEKESNKVTRLERIRYAAAIHIHDSLSRKRLFSSANHMVSVYNALNKAHKRGELNRDQSMAGLDEMLSMIEDWISSINIENPR